MRVLPATLMSGFGTVLVIGSMRWPRPAASTMAVRGLRERASVTGAPCRSSRSGIGRDEARQVMLVPGPQLRQGRMCQVARQVGFDSGKMLQVLRLAVPLVEAGED